VVLRRLSSAYPGARTFELPSGVDVEQVGDRERLADEYVRKLTEAGIQIAAITDYQGGSRPDRRFNRARYDAGQMTGAFAARLKDAADLDAVQADLASVIQRAVEPAHISMWTNHRG
jgi:hypothetical protein